MATEATIDFELFSGARIGMVLSDDPDVDAARVMVVNHSDKPIDAFDRLPAAYELPGPDLWPLPTQARRVGFAHAFRFEEPYLIADLWLMSGAPQHGESEGGGYCACAHIDGGHALELLCVFWSPDPMVPIADAWAP